MLSLKIKDEFEIRGRGLVFVLSLRDNQIIFLNLSLGTKVLVNSKEYEIKGIEYFRGSIGILDDIGILVKELQP
jgi:hypothetical protein